jgi:hypothetical protein
MRKTAAATERAERKRTADRGIPLRVEAEV